MKRSTPNRRGKTEQRADSNRHYGTYIRDNQKGTSKINEIFTRKPEYLLGGKK